MRQGHKRTLHFVPTEDDRQFHRSLGSFDRTELAWIKSQDVPVEENQGVQGLVLRRGRHVPRHRQVREERLNLRCAHVLGMPLLMKENEVPNPMDIGFLGPNGKVLESDHLPHLIQKFDLRIGDENGLLCHRCDI